MKEGWKYVKLGDILDVKHGKDHKEVLSPNGQYPIYGSGGSIMGYATDFLCEKGTTILGRKGTIDKPLYIESRFWNIDTAFGLVPKNGNNSKLIYYICKTIDWKNLDSGAAKPSLTQAIIKKQCANIPPLSEQQRIVEQLDSAFAKIDALKANAEKLVEETKALFAASLREIMTPQEGWEEKKLEDIITSNVVGLTRSKAQQGYNMSFPYFKMNNISHDNTLCWDDLIYVEASQEDIEKYSLEAGDFLFNTRNSKEWVGKSTVYREKIAPVMLYNNNIMRIRFSQNYSPLFICYSFLADYTKQQIEKIKSGTTNVWGIYYRELKNVTVKFPPLSEQTRIVSTLDTLSAQVRQLEANFKKVSEECDALKQAILRETFE